MKKLFSALLLFFFADFVSAQGDFCLTDKIWTEMVRKDSSLYFRRKADDDAISKATNAVHLNQASGQRLLSTGNPVVIPTVIYIIHDGTSATNISMQQIQSQIDQLNQDFDPYGISFCYARRNSVDSTFFVPQAGDSAGVFRINSVLTNINQYTQDAQLKALSNLPSRSYMRIFVVKDIAPSGVLGYAYYPGTSEALEGIVVRADVFGSNNFCPTCNLIPDYNLGAAMTHEAGHYFNLYHTFQGGCITGSGLSACQIYGDRVCDTPPTTGSFGCPSPAPLSCDGINAELIENYMDYTQDACKNSFTAGQNARMDYSLYAYRVSLFSVQNLIATGVTCADIGNQYADFYCANYNGCLNRPLTFTSLSSPGFTYSWDFGDGGTGYGNTIQHTYTTNGQYPVTLNAVNTSQSINASGTIPVFIRDCQPINCSTNKWDFNYGYMDFSSGTPIATNHPAMVEGVYPAFIPDFFFSYFRADSLGKALFHIAYRAIIFNWGALPALYDSSFNFVDTLGIGYTSTALVPVPGRINTFCLVGGSALDSASVNGALNTLTYSIIEAQNGSVRILLGKKMIHIPFPPNTTFFPGVHKIVCGIPGCDVTKVWLIVHLTNFTNKYYVFELDSSGTVSLHQTYTAPSSPDAYQMVPSPDGRKIALVDWGHSATAILSFNKANGNITSYSALGSTYITGLGSFSPNSRFFYQAEQNYNSNRTYNLYQYDLYSAQPYVTRKLIRSFTKNIPVFPYCHAGPDGKLYFGFAGPPRNAPDNYRLAVVNEPDVLDNGLNAVGFNMNGPDIKPANCPYSGINFDGFEGFIDFSDAFGCNWKPGVPAPFNYKPVNCYTYQFFSDDCFSHNWNFGDVGSGANNTSILSNPQHTFTAAGNYLVSRTINGVTTSDTVRIESPGLQISETGLQNCMDLRANYSIALPQTGVNYSWSITNGLPAYVPSAINIDVLWNDTSSIGRIKVVAVNQITGCADSIILNPDFGCELVTSLDQKFEDHDILIQPNPSKENFLISSFSRCNGQLELKLTNMIGETIQEKSYSLNNERLHIWMDTKFLSAGVYTIILKTKYGIVLKKVIKE